MYMIPVKLEFLSKCSFYIHFHLTLTKCLKKIPRIILHAEYKAAIHFYCIPIIIMINILKGMLSFFRGSQATNVLLRIPFWNEQNDVVKLFQAKVR